MPDMTATQSPEDTLRQEMEKIITGTKFPVSRDDLTYFLASYAQHHNLGDDCLEKLRLWLEERDQYMEEDRAIELGG